MEWIVEFFSNFDADTKRGAFWTVLILLHCLQNWVDKGKDMKEKMVHDFVTSPGAPSLRSCIFIGYGVGIADLLILLNGSPSLFGE